MSAMDPRLLVGIFSAIIVTYITIISIYSWVSKHMSKSNIHAEGDKLVYKDVCTLTEESNIREHNKLSDCIEGAEERTKERFEDLIRRMENGFKEVKDLIRNHK